MPNASSASRDGDQSGKTQRAQPPSTPVRSKSSTVLTPTTATTSANGTSGAGTTSSRNSKPPPPLMSQQKQQQQQQQTPSTPSQSPSYSQSRSALKNQSPSSPSPAGRPTSSRVTGHATATDNDGAAMMASGLVAPNAPALHGRRSFGTMSSSARSDALDSTQWGENFWITISDPESGAQFYACPATGDASWDPPTSHFVMPPSDAGEWWELLDETHDIPYYYQTKTKQTQWTRPEGFVIPLGIIQTTTALGRRFSQNARRSMAVEDATSNFSDSPSPRDKGKGKDYGRLKPQTGTGARVSFQDGRRAASERVGGGASGAANASLQGSTSSRRGGGDSRDRERDRDRDRERERDRDRDKDREKSPHGHPLYTIPSEPSNSQHSLHEQGLGLNTKPSYSGSSNQWHTAASTSTAYGNGNGNGYGNGYGYGANGYGNGYGNGSANGYPNGGVNGTPGKTQHTLPRVEAIPADARTVSLQGAAEALIASTSTARGDNNNKRSRAATTSNPKRDESPARANGNGGGGGGLLSLPVPNGDVRRASSSGTFGRSKGNSNGHSNGLGLGLGLSRTESAGTGNGNGSIYGGNEKNKLGVSLLGKGGNASMTDLIGSPVFDKDATKRLNPQAGAKPVLIDPLPLSFGYKSAARISGDRRSLPPELAQDIQQFMASDFAQSYFSTHRKGIIFRRRVPLEEMMSWQKPPLTSPLLVLPRPLHKDAVKIFKVIQRIMGDRLTSEVLPHTPASLAASTTSPLGAAAAALGSSQLGLSSNASADSVPSAHGGGGGANGSAGQGGGGAANGGPRTGGAVSGSLGMLEAERWMLSMGVSQGELRDEIFCQTIKQLTSNPDPDSVFRGWQLLCVILVSFPPSKNLEGYVRSFIQEHANAQRGDPSRIDIMAKYCLGKLSTIAKRGPRGKAPTHAEIETAADAAFNPSTFGASLEMIFRLQQRSYPNAKVPIILPFLADGIIALGGLAAEGIWRISGDGDTISELKTRIDKGYYNLEGIDDCHVPASLLKLWLRELEDPIIPESMYNECLTGSSDPEKCIAIVKKLPTINRRVMLFMISLLQMFLQENIQSVTKMSSVALALVVSPAFVRCTSDQFTTVFTNAQHEHTFIHNLLLHLQPHRIDPDYIPVHGMGSGKAR